MFTREELIESNEFTQREREIQKEILTWKSIITNTKVTGELRLPKYLHENPTNYVKLFSFIHTSHHTQTRVTTFTHHIANAFS